MSGCTSDDPRNHQGDTCPIHEGKAQIQIPIHVRGMVIVEDMRVVRVSLTHYLRDLDEIDDTELDVEGQGIYFVDAAGRRAEFDVNITAPIISMVENDPAMDDFDTYQMEVWTAEGKELYP